MSDDASRLQRAGMALDGELDAANQLAFEQEMAASPELAADFARLQALRQTIRAETGREAAPDRLRARVEALVAPPRTVARPRAGWAAMAAGLAVAAALAGYVAGRATTQGDPTLAALVSGYQRAALSGQPIDVASSDRHTVKPWLAARAPLGSLAPDLADSGYPLVGGRIDIVDRRPAPTLVYRRREHLIAITELPLSQARAGTGALEGYHFERWADKERAYVAISDLDASDLANFAMRFREKAAP